MIEKFLCFCTWSFTTIPTKKNYELTIWNGYDLQNAPLQVTPEFIIMYKSYDGMTDARVSHDKNLWKF